MKMIMILNEVLTKQNLITKIVLQNGNKELSKELKVKIMRIRMAYNKIKQQFDNDVQEFSKQLINSELIELSNKDVKTENDLLRIEELNNKINSEYREFLIQKGYENVILNIDDSLNLDEYSEIVDVNSNNDVEINNSIVKAADFLEAFMDFFVKE